jgi:hypothetical protein
VADFIQQYRETFPEFRKSTDTEIIDTLYDRFGGPDSGVDKADFALSMKGRGPRISPLRAGIEGLKGAAETAIARGAQAVGAEETAQEYLRSAEERGEDVAARYQPVTRSFEDVNDPYTFYRYMLERGGESAPQMAAMLGGGVLGLGARGALGLAGLAAARGIPASAAAAAGSTAVGTGAYTGYNIQRQMEEGTPFEETSLGAAGAAALGQSALDTLSLATILRGFPGLSLGQAGSRVAATARRAVEAGATEALTETGQQALEILQADPEKLFSFSPEVQEELKQAAIAGGLLGGALGGVGGAITYRRPPAAAPETETEGGTETGTEGGQTSTTGTDIDTQAAGTDIDTQAAGIDTQATGVEPPPAQGAAGVEPPPAQGAAVEPPPAQGAAVEPPPVQGAEPGQVTAVEPPPTAQGQQPLAPAPKMAPPTQPEPVPAPKAPSGIELFASPSPPSLPKKLQLGKWNYNYGQQGSFTLNFGSDLEKALFQVSKKTTKPADLQYRDWLKDQGLTDNQIDTLSSDFRQQLTSFIGQKVKAGQTTGTITVPRYNPSMVGLGATAPVPTKAPTPASPAPTGPSVTAAQPPAAPAPQGPEAEPMEFGTGAEPGVTPGQTPFPEQVSRRKTVPVTFGAGINGYQVQTQAPGQATAIITVAREDYDRLQNILPGAIDILGEIHARMFPGMEMKLKVPAGGDSRGGSLVLSPKQFLLQVNPDVLEAEFGTGPNRQTKMLHTLFHELMHPVEEVYLANAPLSVLDAIIKQYVRLRNPSAVNRAAVVYALKRTHVKASDPEFVKGLLSSFGLKARVYEEYVKSTSKQYPISVYLEGPSSSTSLTRDYYRSFTEWVAEQGAAWLVKEAQGLVPKTTFEKFQKAILDRLRKLYREIAKSLGFAPRKGAFEAFLEENYGKRAQVSATPDGSIKDPRIIDYPFDNLESEAQGKPTISKKAVSAYLAKNRPPKTDMAGRAGAGEPLMREERATSPAAPADVEAAQNKLAKAYTKPESMGFKGFLRAIKEAYDSGSYKNLGDKLTYALTDRFIYVKRLQERYVDWLKKQGLSLQAAYDGRHPIAANLSAYAAILGRENVLGQLETLIKYGGKPVIRMFSKSNDPLEKSLDGMLVIDGSDGSAGLTFLADLIREDTLDAFKYYAMAKRVLGKYSDKEAPITQEEAKAIVEHHEKDPVVMKAYKDYQAFNKAMMQMAVDAGVLSQDVADAFLEHNDYYPFYREMDETGRYTGPLFTGGVLTRTKIQKAVGGSAQLEADPVEVIMKNAQFWMHSAAKNVAARKIFTMMESLGDATPIKKGAKLPPDQTEAVVRINGREQYYALKDPVMAAALETTGAQQLPNWTRIPAKFTQFYRELVTRSPDFILKNVFRDPMGAYVTSGVDFNPFAPIRGFVNGIVDPQKIPEMLALQNWGIKGGFRAIPGVEDATQLLNENFKPTSNGIYVVPNGNVLTGIIAKAWNKLGEISEASDAATRMEIYKQVLAKTGNEAEAAFRAQEVINFRKQGASSIVRYMSIMVPFINGRLQGMDVTARAFGPKAFANTMIKGGYLFAASMAMQALFGDDEEYKQLPDYVRYSTMPVPLKLLGLGDSGFVAIPKPFEIGFVFQTFPEVLAQAMMGNIENRDIGKAALEQLKSTFGLALFPQIIAPIAELIVNRSTLTGLPIVTEAQKNLPPELQYTAATSDIVKNLAGSAGLSPVQVEALIKGYGGQIVTSLLGLVDGMYRTASGVGVEKDWTQYPTVSTFLKTQANTNPKGVADIYRLSAEIQGVTTAINTYVAQGQADKAANLMKENEGLLTIKQSVSALRTQLNTLSRNERMLVNNPNIPQDQKNAQLDQIKEARRQIGRVMTESLIDKTGK